MGVLAFIVMIALSVIVVNAFNLLSSGFMLITDTGNCETSTLGTTINYNNNTTVIAWLVSDAVGTPIASGWANDPAFNYIVNNGEDFTLSAIQTIRARPLTLKVYELAVSPILGFNTQTLYDFIQANAGATIAVNVFDPATVIPDCANLATGSASGSGNAGNGHIFYDGRINDFDTGNPVVLYGYQDGNANRGLTVYGANDEGLLMQVTPSEIASVPECPTINTMIANNGSISLYRLAERSDGRCPFQLNAPTGDGSKTYIIIFDSLDTHTYYESWEE